MVTSVDLAGYFPIKQSKPMFLSMLLSVLWCLLIIIVPIGLLALGHSGHGGNALGQSHYTAGRPYYCTTDFSRWGKNL